MEKIGITREDLDTIWAQNETDWIFKKYATSTEKATYNNMLWNNDTKIALSAETYREKIAATYYEQAKKDYEEAQLKKKEEPIKNNETAALQENKATDSGKNTTKTISQEEYNKLTDTEKTNWVVVTETEVDTDLTNQLSSVGDAEGVISKLQPLQPLYKMIPQPLPGEQLSSLLDTLETFFKLLDPIEALAKMPPPSSTIINPLVNFINKLFQVIGMLLMLNMMVAKGQKVFTDDLCNAVDQIDWEGLNEAVEKYKKKMSDTADSAKQKTEEVMNSESSESDVKRKMYDLAEQQKDKLSDESKKIIAETKKEIQSLQDTVMMADTASKAVKLYKENVAITFSSEEQIKKAIKVMSKVGVDFSPLLAPSKEAQEAIDKMFPDPTKQVNKINSLVKKMNKPQEKKYARIEEQNTVVEEAKMCTVEPPPLVGLKNKLSTNYCVGDLCYSDTAKVCKIDNTPPQYVADNLKLVSEIVYIY